MRKVFDSTDEHFTHRAERQRIAKLLRYCSGKGMLDLGILCHAFLTKKGFEHDLMIGNDLINMYGKCGRVEVSQLIFQRLPERNVVSWTSLMGGYLLMGKPEESMKLLCQMVSCVAKPNEFTYSTVLKACGYKENLGFGVQVHVLCIKLGFEVYLVIGNSVIDMYFKNKMLNDARRMFDTMHSRNVITWNSMIIGYSHGGHWRTSLRLFTNMMDLGVEPDEFTYSGIIKACSSLGALREGRQIHAFLISTQCLPSDGTVTESSLVDLYVKCGCLSDARRVFDRACRKNTISWTAIVVGYAQEGNLKEAIDLFSKLRESGIQIDGYVLSAVVGLLADFALLEQGRQIHCYAMKISSRLDVSMANSIVDMYIKCGIIEEAEKRFAEIQTKNVVSWTVMITGYGKYGKGREAITLFEEMLAKGIEPDEVTYLAILSACSHAGLLAECQKYFSIMCQTNSKQLKVEHYACMVDCLARAGRLEEGKRLIESMPFKAIVGIWQTLLGACKVQDLKLAEEIGEILFNLESDNPVNYVMLSNIYAKAGEWSHCNKLRDIMKMKGIKKDAGRSWVEIDKEVHFFYGGDDLHPLTFEIREILKGIEMRLKEDTNYSFTTSCAMHDVEDESREDNLRLHSERLAIGLALLRGGYEGNMIRVFKNLRICGDCHEFVKGLSTLIKRVILVRDANRFHMFKNGTCSCGDFW